MFWVGFKGCHVCSSQPTVSGVCTVNQVAAFSGKQNSWRSDSQYSTQKNIWDVCFSKQWFSSFQLEWMFIFLADYQNKSIKSVALGKCWGLQMPPSWNACFVTFLIFPTEAVMFSCFFPCSPGNILLYLEFVAPIPGILTRSDTGQTFLLYGCKSSHLILRLAWGHIKTRLELH